MYGLGIIKGMMVTLRHLRRKPVTRQYPEEPVPLSPRFRGYDFAWVEERCTACATCAKACPHGCIDIVTHTLPSGQYAIDRFDVDVGLCMVCGLCVEACPYDALFMGVGFEQSSYRRSDLIVRKEDIANRAHMSAYYRPPLKEQWASRQNVQERYRATQGEPYPAKPAENK